MWLGLNSPDSFGELLVESTEGPELNWWRLESDSAADAEDPVSSLRFANCSE